MERVELEREQGAAARHGTAQRQEDTGGFADGRAATAQLAAQQVRADASPRVAQLQEMADLADAGTVQRNDTGMPDNLKAGIESLSGMDMSSVRVHRNSDKPAQLNAHAYAQGTDIHLAPGQERHLPHEAWHVVQQMQGRVQPTMSAGNGTELNVDAGLEREADLMGAKVQGAVSQRYKIDDAPVRVSRPGHVNRETIQRKPKDINSRWQLHIVGDNVANTPAGRNDRTVAWSLNKLKDYGVESDYLGGHLFKAEYGGHDDISNVVPWTQTAESKYSTFERAYLRSAKGAVSAPGGSATSNISTKATFKDVNAIHANDIKGNRPSEFKIRKPAIAKVVNRALSLIPTKVVSKDDRRNEVELGGNDIGHVLNVHSEGLTKLVNESDDYIQAIEDDIGRVERRE